MSYRRSVVDSNPGRQKVGGVTDIWDPLCKYSNPERKIIVRAGSDGPCQENSTKISKTIS